MEEAEPGDGFENATYIWQPRSSEVSALTSRSRRRLWPLSVMPSYTLRLGSSSRRPDFGSLVADVPWWHRARQLTPDCAGHRADGSGPGVFNRADGAGQLEPVELWVTGAE